MGWTEWRPPAPRPRGPRGVFGAALALSAVIHLLVLLALRFAVVVPGQAYLLEPGPETVLVLPGMQVFDVTPVTIDVAPLPPVMETTDPQPAPATADAPPVDLPPPTIETGEAEPPPTRTLTDLVRPRSSDPRLWVPLLPPVERPLDPREMLEARVASQLAAWNDSMVAEAAAAARALDWTTTDAEGNKWGISPGKIHLGSVTLPLPFGFAPPPGVRDEMRGRLRGWAAIQDQVGRAEVSHAFKDRVKAIRELREAQRDTTKARTKKN